MGEHSFRSPVRRAKLVDTCLSQLNGLWTLWRLLLTEAAARTRGVGGEIHRPKLASLFPGHPPTPSSYLISCCSSLLFLDQCSNVQCLRVRRPPGHQHLVTAPPILTPTSDPLHLNSFTYLPHNALSRHPPKTPFPDTLPSASHATIVTAANKQLRCERLEQPRRRRLSR